MKLTIRMLLPCMLLSSLLFARENILMGTSTGLYDIDSAAPTRLWDKADVRKIIKDGDTWFFLTGAGIWTSKDLVNYEERNEGLPVKVVKTYDDGKKGFVREVQELKDLELHPTNPLVLVTATKDSIYLTRDGGHSWKNIGMSAATAGVKAVAVLDLPDASGRMQLTVIMSHPIYGISWRQPDVQKAWADLDTGLEQMPTIKWPDEVADLQAVNRGGSVDVYASQTFLPQIYRLDWEGKKFDRIWAGTGYIDTVEGLSVTEKAIYFSGPGQIRAVPVVPGKQAIPAPAGAGMRVSDWDSAFAAVPGGALSAWIPESRSNGKGALSLSELWLLKPDARTGKFALAANGKKGIYIPVHQITTDAGLDGHLKTIRNNGLNMLVVDMKDDIGTLRYDAKDPLVLKKGRLGKGVELESFVRKAKANGIYLVARIVVFKDKSLASWGGGRYAVWDKVGNCAWQGYEYVTQKIQTAGEAAPAGTASVTPGAPAQNSIVRKYYDEFWVDPYCEEVWEYDVAIAKELISRGFDEIQFDYIRFPTDGTNLDNATYRWRDEGMDKESALMSFLSYARKEIAAPISIDIYGANGWYRTGARTGQDVELLSRYVDAICPMFYPSHFEQTFLAQTPASERPYRIYYYGSYRNTVIAKNRVVVRPWAQAFYLNVSYDKTWYNSDYVQRQIFGARDSVNTGYTYWNNSGRYGDLRPDITMAVPYPWEAPEAGAANARPVFGGQ